MFHWPDSWQRYDQIHLNAPTSTKSCIERGEQHIRWCLKQECDHIRSQSPTKPIPTTLHAAKYKESLTSGARNPNQTGSSNAAGNASSTPNLHNTPTILMPHPNFRNVHSHYVTGPITINLRSTTTDSTTDSAVDFTAKVPTPPIPIPSNTNTKHTQQRTQVNLRQHRKGGSRAPRRKRTNLEDLPALSSAVAAEIAHRKLVTEQAARFAEIREAQELEAEMARREHVRREHPVPEFVLRIDRYEGEDLADFLPALIKTTPAASPERKRGREKAAQQQQEQQMEGAGADADGKDVAGNPNAPNPTEERHITWAPNLVQCRQQHFRIDVLKSDPPVAPTTRRVRRVRSTAGLSKMGKGGAAKGR